MFCQTKYGLVLVYFVLIQQKIVYLMCILQEINEVDKVMLEKLLKYLKWLTI